MAATSIIKLYRIRQGYDFAKIEKKITEKYGYSEFVMSSVIQSENNFRIKAYQRANPGDPDWVKLIKPYLQNSVLFDDKKLYSSIIFLFHKAVDENKDVIVDSYEDCYVVTGGSGSHNILSELDYQFGIEILERIFNPDENKLDSVNEKTVIGDVLASNRFYRRARSLAFEDDFGKFFQGFNLKISKQQVLDYFPSIAEYKGDSLKDILSISCGDNIEIKAKLDFITFIKFLKDVIYILSIETEKIFNQSLVPLSIRKEKRTVLDLNRKLRNRVVKAIIDDEIESLDFDICARNYEKFYSSTGYKIYIGELHSNSPFKEPILPIAGDNIRDLNQTAFFNSIANKIICSHEYNQAGNKEFFLKELLPKIKISTFHGDGSVSTSGTVLSYLQTELVGQKSYFYIDSTWYFLKEKFDESIIAKYINRIPPRIQQYNFVQEWDVENETSYNEKYDSKSNPLYLHTVNIRHVELCDALYVEDEIVYIIHVKHGIGATIRDLVSQVFISARILEEEMRTGELEYIQELYNSAVRRNRIDAHLLSFEQFLSYLKKNREYCLIIYDENINEVQFAIADYGSRIAKFSLIEFAGMMHANDWDFSIVKI
jgi:hypothetical protein